MARLPNLPEGVYYVRSGVIQMGAADMETATEFVRSLGLEVGGLDGVYTLIKDANGKRIGDIFPAREGDCHITLPAQYLANLES